MNKMPEIKLKHVVSFSSEDKIHKAENILKSETYRKWKCATPGEKNATIVLQFEKATRIHSIDIGNESSAFVEVLVGRSSDSLNDYQVLLVASSFMSPLESRNETHTNRVRMFGPDKLAQNLKDEKWDCAQVVCTQPFNKNIAYGLSFIKFHSSPEKIEESTENLEAKNTTVKIGAFTLKCDDEDGDYSLPSVGSWFGKRKMSSGDKSHDTKVKSEAPSYAAAVLASCSDSPKLSFQDSGSKRKYNSDEKNSQEPSSKKEFQEAQAKTESSARVNKDPTNIETIRPSPKTEVKAYNIKRKRYSNANKIEGGQEDKPFKKIMEKVVFVLSGFVNPLRRELRDQALAMGAKYKGDWDSSCTHLICAFVNTPKYIQVQSEGGRIVSKNWIIDCHSKRKLLPSRKYVLVNTDSTDESESEEEVEVRRPNVKASPKLNGSSFSPQANKKMEQDTAVKNSSIRDKNEMKDLDESDAKEEDSETEDEDALEDYMADTDVDSESAWDTESEIRKVESKAKRKAADVSSTNSSNVNSKKIKDPDIKSLKPDIEDLPLPELPNLFKSKHFYLYGDFASKVEHDLQRYITAYNGLLEDYMSGSIKYVITESKWDQNFEKAVAENEDLIFVKPQWIYKCHESKRLVPYQPYIIIPDS